MKYTEEQKKAITQRGKSLLLSAAAGSGKTAVLVARIIGLICDENGPDINKLLVVTFTKLAASEMRDRIYREINKRAKKDPLNKKLKKQLLLLPSANIKTIDSFYLDFIKNNIHLTNLPINFRIGGEMEIDILKQRCISELIEDKYEEGNEEFLNLMDTYGYGRDDRMIIDIILSVYNFSMSLSNPIKYYDLCIENIIASSENFQAAIFSEIIIKRLFEILEDYKKKYEIALYEIEIQPDFEKYYSVFNEELGFIEELLTKNSFLQIQQEISFFEFKKFPVVRGVDNSFIKGIRDDFKGEINKFSDIINISLKDEENDSKTILSFAKTVISLCLEFKERFESGKLRKSLVDFPDFAHIVLSILTDESGEATDVAVQLRANFYEILVDEYQDTNEIQDRIFEILSKDKKNLFMVGDVKQSIYKFRQARPEIFISKKEDFKNSENELVLLSNNFRSREEVIDSINVIFYEIMKKETSMTDYKEEALVYTANYETAVNSNHKTEVLVFDKSLKTDDDTELSDEAVMVANSIKQLINDESFQLFDIKEENFRKAQYSDIVILLRSMGEFGHTFYDTLNRCGIPVTADFSEDLYESAEILSVISVLKAIDNPLDDIALLSLLKSPAFNFSESQIFSIKNLDINAPFYYSLLKSRDEKAVSVVDFLNEYKDIAYTESLSFLVNSLYKSLKIKEIFSALQNGTQRIINLNIFKKLVRDFEKLNYQGLKSFILYLDNAKNSNKKIPSEVSDTNKNSVRLMTIHKSKGLEFPVVYVSGLGRQFNRDDIKAKVIVHPELGMGMDYIDIQKRYSNYTLTKNAFKIKIRDELLSEELRVLYVALTRAKEKLIITGAVSDYEKKREKWERISQTGGLNKNTLLNLPSFLEYIMPVILFDNHFDLKLSGEIEEVFDEVEVNEKIIKYDEESIFYEYKDINLSQISAKITVSQANRQKIDEYSKRITFESLERFENLYSGSEYGTYFHKMFEMLPILEIREGKTADELLKKLIAEEKIELQAYTDDVINKISAFFETETGKSLINSDEFYRERSFLVRIPANEVYPVEFTHPVMLQGTVDCYYIKNNEIVLIDFKTDKITREEVIRKNYSEQIKLYSYALEKIENKRVVKKIIYLANNNVEILF